MVELHYIIRFITQISGILPNKSIPDIRIFRLSELIFSSDDVLITGFHCIRNDSSVEDIKIECFMNALINSRHM